MKINISIDHTFDVEELFSKSRLEFFEREGFKGEALRNEMIKEVEWELLYGDLVKSIPSYSLNITVE